MPSSRLASFDDRVQGPLIAARAGPVMNSVQSQSTASSSLHEKSQAYLKLIKTIMTGIEFCSLNAWFFIRMVSFLPSSAFSTSHHFHTSVTCGCDSRNGGRRSSGTSLSRRAERLGRTGVTLLMRRNRRGTIMTVSKMLPVPSLVKTGMVAAFIRLIEGRHCMVRLRVGFLSSDRSVGGLGDRGESILRDLVFHLGLPVINYASQLVKTFSNLGLIEGAVLDLLHNESGDGDGKGWGIDHPYRNHVTALGMSYKLLYSIFPCLI